MAYLLDTNVFIQAKNLHYGLDFCPAFWDWLTRQNTAGLIFSIEKVGDEIASGADELSDWSKARGATFFLKPDAAIVASLGAVSNWATNQAYEQVAISTFLQVADYFLIAHALAHGYTVVSHEIPSDSRRKIKIPNVCIGLGVKCMTPFEMLRLERARFVLAT
jgi:predicted nucleic acid-binding protein